MKGSRLFSQFLKEVFRDLDLKYALADFDSNVIGWFEVFFVISQAVSIPKFTGCFFALE